MIPKKCVCVCVCVFRRRKKACDTKVVHIIAITTSHKTRTTDDSINI